MDRIYIIEDDDNIRNLLKIALEGFGYDTESFETAEEGLARMKEEAPSLAIFDWMLPGMDGITAIKEIRSTEGLKNIPIMVLTAREKELDKVVGLDCGADDYMVKPIELDELLLRVRALLRRANIEMERKITVGNLILDADAMSAEIDGEEISLTTREFNIIYKLLSYPKKTFSRAQLMDEFWGVETDTSLRAVDVYVTKLRDKLSACDGFKIVTVRGLGYKVVLQ